MASHYPPDLLEAIRPAIAKPNLALLASNRFYLASPEGGAPAACGGWSDDPPPGSPGAPGLAHLRHFATDARFAGRGLGRAILERCLADIRRAGLSRVRTESTLNAEPFYRAMGFRPLLLTEIPFGRAATRLAIVVMERAP